MSTNDPTNLKGLYPHLKPLERGNSSYKCAAANIRADLKNKFPQSKFSVTSDSNAVNVRWDDGPTSKAVQDVTYKYKLGHFDGMADYYEPNGSVFAEVFGGVSYVFDHREISDDVLDTVVGHMYEFMSEDLGFVQRASGRAMLHDQTMLPASCRTVSEIVNTLSYSWDAVANKYDTRYSKWPVEKMYTRMDAKKRNNDAGLDGEISDHLCSYIIEYNEHVRLTEERPDDTTISADYLDDCRERIYELIASAGLEPKQVFNEGDAMYADIKRRVVRL